MRNRPSPESVPTPARTESPFGREFGLLEEMAQTILEAGDLLLAALERRTPFQPAWHAIRDLEHKGDAIARDIFDSLLERSQGVESDRFRSLTGYLDDVLDGIEAAAARLALHRIDKVLPEAVELGRIVQALGKELAQAIGPLRRTEDVFRHTRTLHRLENRGDDVLRDAIETLFSRNTSAQEIVKWKDICELLEATTDRCEDVANVLETFVVTSGGGDRLSAGRVVVDVERHEVRVDAEPVAVSLKEFGLLHLLLRHQGKVVRRERLLREVWGDDFFGDTRTLDTHIGWLRKKVETRGGVRIAAVRGIGYRLDLGEHEG
ncbi:MAG: DUF47 family protein [Armatimonadota bacterium]|nr:DUF47 family protein [Armatimonadota bacterium]